jgi:hypothetical protein
MDYSVDHALGNLGAAWAVKEDGRPAPVGTLQGGELLPQREDIEHATS